jgi:hypothetical protein
MILNYTKHPIRLQNGLEIPSSGVARCREYWNTSDPIDGIETEKKALGPVYGLPNPSPGVLYVVSKLVSKALPERMDLMTPGRRILDKHGRVILQNLCLMVPLSNIYIEPYQRRAQ